MFGIDTVRKALANLAASINNLSSVVDVAAGHLRQQLALEDRTPPTHTVIDAHALPSPPDGHRGDDGHSNGRRGRKAAASV